MECLPEPLDGLLKSMLSFPLILFVYLYPIFRGLISLWMKRILKIFVNHDRYHQKRHTHFPKLHIKVFDADADKGRGAFSWDTDGIPFLVDNPATAIICSERKLFTGHLSPMRICFSLLDWTAGIGTIPVHSCPVVAING